jgi:hypothetical protein
MKTWWGDAHFVDPNSCSSRRRHLFRCVVHGARTQRQRACERGARNCAHARGHDDRLRAEIDDQWALTHLALSGWLTRQAALAAQLIAPATWVIWDEVVVAYTLGMARGSEVPRPQLRTDLSFAHPDTARRITWLDQIDTGRVWQDFTRKIDARGR